MTADEARRITADAGKPDARKIQALVDLWRRGIEDAARRGFRYVTARDVGNLRTPVSSSEREAALERLRANGFTVVPNAAGDIRVTW
jgi:hypothetical protein